MKTRTHTGSTAPSRMGVRRRLPAWGASLALTCLAWLSPGGATAQTPPPGAVADVTVLRNVTLVDVDSGQLHPGWTVVWERSRIVSAGPSDEVVEPQGAQRIDGGGRYLIPGLWDMHVHVWAAAGVAAHTETQVLPAFIAHGVTAVRDMGDGSMLDSGVPTKHRWDVEARAGARIGPRIVAAGTFPVNGPHGGEPGFTNASTPAEARKLVRFFKDEGSADFIKVYSQIPRDAYFAMMDEARRAGIPVAGHKPLTVSFVEAADAGQRSMEHAREILLDSFPGAAQMQRAGGERNLPPARLKAILQAHAPAMLQAIFDAMGRNDAYYTPTHLTRLFDWKAAARDAAYLNDPRLAQLTEAQRIETRNDVVRTQQRAAQPGDAQVYQAFFEKGLEATGLAQRAGVNLLAGTDAGDSYCFPGSSLHDELGWLVKAGLTPLQALRAATVNPARFIGRSQDFGGIGAGKLADLVLLDGNPLEDIGNTRRIHTVVMNGRVFGPDALARIGRSLSAGDH